MKEPYGEGLATHTGPESCVGRPRGGRRSVDRGTCGLGIGPRKNTHPRRRACATMGKAAKAEAHDARTGEAGPLHSTGEAGEQSRETGGGAGAGKGGGQGEHGPAKHGRGERATGAGPCTRGRKRALLRQTPEAGARCVSRAGRDPCGGRGVTRVPTVIEFPCHRISWNLSRNSRSQSRRDSSRAMSWSSHCNR